MNSIEAYTSSTLDCPKIESEDADETDEIEVELRPFKYMAGGHNYLLEVSRSAICKVYREEEVSFYKRMPKELEPFTPKYLGDISVTFETVGGQNHFRARIPRPVAERCNVISETIGFCSGSADDRKPKTLNGYGQYENSILKTRETKSQLEEWSKHCLSIYHKSTGIWESQQTRSFIVLENLVCSYDRPSILDIKLGKRPKKENLADDSLRHQRCIGGQNQDLKFRIDGYKKYDKATGSYTVLHKNEARGFSAEQVVKEISNFFHDGTKLRVDAILKILDQLDALRRVFSPEKQWRFNAASLLLTYDHCETVKQDCAINNSSQSTAKTRGVSCVCNECANIISPESFAQPPQLISRGESERLGSHSLQKHATKKSDAVGTHPFAEHDLSASQSFGLHFSPVCDTNKLNIACSNLLPVADTDNSEWDKTSDNITCECPTRRGYWLKTVKAEVKLVDFQKTDFCEKILDENENDAQAIVIDILKLTEILSGILCKVS